MQRQDIDLLAHGNGALCRLLVALNDAGSEGLATYELLHRLGSTRHGKAVLYRAAGLGLVERDAGARQGGRFATVNNRLTAKGRQLLQSQLRP